MKALPKFLLTPATILMGNGTYVDVFASLSSRYNLKDQRYERVGFIYSTEDFFESATFNSNKSTTLTFLNGKSVEIVFINKGIVVNADNPVIFEVSFISAENFERD